MTISRDTWLAVGLLLLLVVVVAVTAVAQSRPTYPPLSSLSAAPDGAKALRLWLNELGYVTHARAVAAFEAPAGSSLALVLEPSQPVSGADLRALDRFLDAGGTLVAAGSRSEAQTLARHFDFELNSLAEATTVRALQAPLLASPPPAQVAVRTAAYLQSERGDFVTHLAVPEGPVLVSFAQGEGRVFLSATAMPFANASLKADGNGALVLSMVSAATRRGVVWFDEWHHGLQLATAEPVGPSQWLTQSATGRALLFAAAVLFLALLLQGRAFGRPLPVPRATMRRAPLEYVTAMANLKRRSGQRQAVLRQYHDWLKRDVGRRYRLSPALPDEGYAAQLARFDPSLDAGRLRSLLARLSQVDVGERELVQLAGEATDWLDGRSSSYAPASLTTDH